MTFCEQPTILFVPLECRYVTAASAAALQLQPDARATELPETMREGRIEGEREREGREQSDRKMGKGKNAAGY